MIDEVQKNIHASDAIENYEVQKNIHASNATEDNATNYSFEKMLWIFFT